MCFLVICFVCLLRSFERFCCELDLEAVCFLGSCVVLALWFSDGFCCQDGFLTVSLGNW